MIRYRLAEPADAEALRMMNDWLQEQPCNTAAGIAASLRDNRREIVCLAEEDGAPVGFCCGQVYESMCYSTPCGEITELYVEKSHRRIGVGTGLLACMEAELQARGVRSWHLYTGMMNDVAQHLYRACGYGGKQEMMYKKGI